MERILLLGAPGHISTHTANEAFRLGHEVAAVKRTEKEEEDLCFPMKMYYGDRDNRCFLEAVIADYQPDVVVDFVCYKYSVCRKSPAKAGLFRMYKI